MKDGKFTKEDCSIHIGGSVGEAYIELSIANALLPQLKEQWLAELLKDLLAQAPVGYARCRGFNTNDDNDARLNGRHCEAPKYSARLVDIVEINSTIRELKK